MALLQICFSIYLATIVPHSNYCKKHTCDMKPSLRVYTVTNYKHDYCIFQGDTVFPQSTNCRHPMASQMWCGCGSSNEDTVF